MQKLILVTTALLVALVLAQSADAAKHKVSMKQARADVHKYERTIDGEYTVEKCKRAYGLVVCPVLRYGISIEGFPESDADGWQWYDCVDHDRTVINSLFTDQDDVGDCLWAIDRVFPEPDIPSE